MNENQNPKKNLFPIISFFDAKACEDFNLDDGKIQIIPEKSLESVFGGKKIEIAFALPNEEMSIKCLAYKREKYYFFQGLKGSANQNRIEPPCRHFGNCGGCLFQHMKIDYYKEFKRRMLEKIFIDAGLEGEINKILEMSIIGPNLRRKANFEGLKKNGEIFLGFHRFGSRQIIDVNSCEIMNSKISKLLMPLKALLIHLLEDFQKCEFFIVNAENGIDIGFEIHGAKILKPEGAEEKIMKFCEANQDVIRFSFNAGKNSKIIYQKKDSEEPFLKFGEFKVKVDSNSFMQTSKEAEAEILSAIKDCFPENHKELSLIDLFCGRGTYALNFVHEFASIYGFELDEAALKDFGGAIRSAPEEISKKIKLFKQNLFEEEFLENFFSYNQFVIVNPPRAGAEKVCEQISKSINKPKNIIYVSCGPKTFARDAKILIDSGYKIKRIKPIDQFIWSGHLELVAHFELSDI